MSEFGLGRILAWASMDMGEVEELWVSIGTATSLTMARGSPRRREARVRGTPKIEGHSQAGLVRFLSIVRGTEKKRDLWNKVDDAAVNILFRQQNIVVDGVKNTKINY